MSIYFIFNEAPMNKLVPRNFAFEDGVDIWSNWLRLRIGLWKFPL